MVTFLISPSSDGREEEMLLGLGIKTGTHYSGMLQLSMIPMNNCQFSVIKGKTGLQSAEKVS